MEPSTDPGTGPTLAGVGDDDFADVVLGATVPVVVHFHASWCEPCREVEPVLGRLAATLTGLRVLALDVDASPRTASVYRVSGVPTLIAFDRGEPVLRIAGARPEAFLVRLLTGLSRPAGSAAAPPGP